MRRTSVLVTVAFLTGLAIGHFARRAVIPTPPRTDMHAADLVAIEKLHREDIEVTLSQDPKGLLDIWTEDGVRLSSGGVPAVGKQAIQAENQKVHAQYLGFKVLSYVPKYKNIQIEDGLACEWFEREGEYKLSLDSPPVSWHAKELQVLKRQNDGSWKFALLDLK
jgi:ketosteroid isomerase-like protein